MFSLTISSMKEFIVRLFKDVIGAYVFWIVIHWLSSHFYLKYCVGNTIIGILMSPFIIPTPQCIAMRWIIFNGGRMIEVMWVVLGKWLIERLLLFNLYKGN